MTSRERVLCALAHEEPDRVPVFFGTSGVTTMLVPAYDRLKAHLGLAGETISFWRAMQYAIIDEEVLQRFGSDGRMLVPGPAPARNERELADDGFVDGWGISWRRTAGGFYYESFDPPLARVGIDDIDAYPWPDLAHPSRFVGLEEKARAIQAEGYAVVGLSGASPFETCGMLRGLENWMVDLAADPGFAIALLKRVNDLQLTALEALLREAGPLLDLVVISDDLASQSAPLISPTMYRELIKPFHAELIAAIRRGSQAKVFYHSCGNVRLLIEDLIEVGVDVLNPVQVSSAGLEDTGRLKQDFGRRISFCGAIDTQSVLPCGTPAEVRAEVRRRIADLAPGGGYLLAAVHCIQPDVPTENVIAMFEEAHAAGIYPISAVAAVRPQGNNVGRNINGKQA